MSRMGDKLLTEKTRIMVTISNFVLLILTIISGVAFSVNWKSDIEHRVASNESKIVVVKQDVESGKNAQVETQTKLAEIQTDLKWIKSYLIGLGNK